jgi:vacuolar-type H+-ATPase subunit E/Vma4
MGQDQLIKAPEEETRRETERIITEAEADAEAIIREATEVAERERQERLGSFKKEFEKKKAAAINRARAGEGGRLLAERTGIIESVFEEALKRFEGLPEGEYGDIIRRFYRELKAEWQAEKANKGNKPRVHISPGDLDFIKDPDVEFVPDDKVSLGCVFVYKNGRVRAENTFSSRLKRARAGLIVELDRILFG